MAEPKKPPTLATPPGLPPEPAFPAKPPEPVEAPIPGAHTRPAKVPMGPAREYDKEQYRVLVRHFPVPRHKNLLVNATDEASAWEAYQAELARLLTAEGEPGKRVLASFQTWLGQQPPHRIPPDVSISKEDDYQALRKKVRERAPQPVNP